MSNPNWPGGPGQVPNQPPGYANPPVYYPMMPPRPPDAKSTGFAVLGFFVPVAGLVLWLVWKDETPLKASSAGKGALAGVITSAALGIIVAIIYVVMIMMLVQSMP